MIEIVGHYNAQTEPSTIKLDEDRIRTGCDAARSRPTRSASSSSIQGIDAAAPVRPPRRWPPRRLLVYLARALVTEPDEVKVEEFAEDDGTVVLELAVAEDDYGKVIGRGGRTANALRTVVKAAAVQGGRRVLVDIVD